MSGKKKGQQGPTRSVGVTQAVNAAFEFLSTAFAEKETLREPRLEEIELLDAENKWLVTLSFLRKVAPDTIVTSPLAIPTSQLHGEKYAREYKSLSVDASTGEVQSMKIRAAV